MAEPVDLSERTLQNLSASIVAGINGRGGPPQGNNRTAPTGGGRDWSEDIARLGVGANNFVSSVGLLTQGTYGLTQATGDIGKVIGMFGPVGQGLAQFGEGVTGIAVDTNKMMMDVSKSGFRFDQNLGLFSSSVLGAQMSMPGFKRMIEDSGKSLAGLSGTATNSAIAYLAMLQEINENPDVYKLRLTGIDDFDQTLRQSASMSRNLNMLDASSKKSVIDSAVQMATEMDNIARLTGKSRQEQQKQIDQQMQKAEMEIFLLAATKDQQIALKDNSTYLGKYSQEVRDFATELTVSKGNVVSKSGTVTAAALENIAPGSTALFKQMGQADALGDSPAAKARRKEIQAEIDAVFSRLANNSKKLEEIALLRAADGDAVTKQMGNIVAGSKEELLVMQKMAQERKAGESDSSVRQRVMKMIDDERKAAGTKDADPGSRPSQAMEAADIFFKQVSSGWGSALEGLNTKSGLFITNLDGMNKVFTARTQAEIALLPAELKKWAGYSGVEVTKDTVSAVNKDRVPGKALGDEFIPAGWRGLVGEKGPEMIEVGGQSSIKSNTVSMGLLDQAVSKLPVMMAGMQNELKFAMHEAKNSMPSAKDFDSLFSNFKTTFSSQVAPEDQKYQQASAMPSDASSALQKGIDLLNTSVKQLITAVEDGTYKNVKAVKSTGNMLA